MGWTLGGVFGRSIWCRPPLSSLLSQEGNLGDLYLLILTRLCAHEGDGGPILALSAVVIPTVSRLVHRPLLCHELGRARLQVWSHSCSCCEHSTKTAETSFETVGTLLWPQNESKTSSPSCDLAKQPSLSLVQHGRLGQLDQTENVVSRERQTTRRRLFETNSLVDCRFGVWP